MINPERNREIQLRKRIAIAVRRRPKDHRPLAIAGLDGFACLRQMDGENNQHETVDSGGGGFNPPIPLCAVGIG